MRFVRRLNPGVPIPASASAIHGIFDRDVADCPRFEVVAPILARFLENADLCGYNLSRFDLPLLLNEFARVGESFSVDGRRIIDVQRLFHRLDSRTLSAAVRRYLGHEHEPAHQAIGDARATAAVLDCMLATHREVPRDVAQLHALLHEVDVAGRLRLIGGQVVVWFGKYYGQPLKALPDMTQATWSGS
jgi:DNA polymerase-3 subunit epsilon